MWKRGWRSAAFDWKGARTHAPSVVHMLHVTAKVPLAS
jgi:hypothetical protein